MVDVLSRIRSTTAAPLLPPAETPPCSPFWQKYNAIEANLNSIELVIDDLTRNQNELNQCSDNSRVNQMREQMDGQLRQCTQRAQTIRKDIQDLERAINDLDEESPGSPEVRLQRNHFQLLRNRFSDVVTRFTDLSKDIKTKFVKTVTRQCRIAGVEDIDESKIEQIMLVHPEMLQQNIFQLRGGQQTREITEAYNAIASRHQAILDIERGVNELLDLFVQFAIVVRDQGRMIDNIGQNVAAAREYVEDGVQQLELAKEHQKSSRKCLWCMVLIGVVVLIVAIVLAIVLT